ncbi:MAG: hypothetical protein QOI06_364 [Nocardioidaceae bacterium]|jgi:hypothetical protein|nr:hypothetical protein [Nocardioidaceae bacterium]
MSFDNLLGGPAPTYLPEDPAAAALAEGMSAEGAATAHPSSSLAWAILAEEHLSSGDSLTGYAFARVGYHRGLDALRRSGWKGHGPIPWAHEPNQGFLRCLAALALGSQRIGEDDEAARCREFLLDADPSFPGS